MICSGEYKPKDKACYLCSEVNKEAYKQCIKTIQERDKREEREIIVNFFAKHCKHAEDCYGDDGSYVGCKLDTEYGDYGNCTPFEYDCIYKENKV